MSLALGLRALPMLSPTSHRGMRLLRVRLLPYKTASTAKRLVGSSLERVRLRTVRFRLFG